MSNIGVTIHALTKKEGRLRAIANNCVEQVQAVLVSTAHDMVNDLQVYPPQVVRVRNGRNVAQRYQRTRNLQRGWQVAEGNLDFARAGVALGRELSVSIFNNVQDSGEGYKRYPRGTEQDFVGQEYASRVQDETQQRPIHRGRWTNTIQAVRQKHSAALRGACRAAVHKAVQQGGQ